MDLTNSRAEIYNRFQCIAEIYCEFWLLSETVDDFMERVITIDEISLITGIKRPVSIMHDNKAVSMISIEMSEFGMPVINVFHPADGDESIPADELDSSYLSVIVSLLRGLRYELIDIKLSTKEL